MAEEGNAILFYFILLYFILGKKWVIRGKKLSIIVGLFEHNSKIFEHKELA